MDPVSALGLGASIIAVVQLTQSVLKLLGPFAHNKSDLNRLLALINGFKGAYDSLGHRLEYSEDDESRAALLKSLEEPAKECKLVFECLQEQLGNVNFVRQYIIGCRFDKKFKACLDRLKDQKELFELVMQADQHVMLREIKKFSVKTEEILNLIQSSTEDIGNRLDTFAQFSLEQREEARARYFKTEEDLEKVHSIVQARGRNEDERLKAEHRKDIIGWLSNTDPFSNHNAAKEKRAKTTGNWFIKGKAYDEWVKGASSFLWLHGIPGCGKSILCSTIIEETISRCSTGEGTGKLAYYYFSFTDNEKQKPVNFLRSVLAQLFEQAEIPDVMKKLHDDYKSSEPPLHDLNVALRSVLETSTPCFIIIDALDECPPNDRTREQLCELLVEICAWSFPNLHILATSRELPYIKENLSAIDRLIQIPIQNSEVDADIRVYVQSQIATDAKFGDWVKKIESIETILVEKAHGMFRWVYCQIEVLRKCRSRNEVAKALKSLPKNLDETYQRILEGIDQDDRKLARSALQWLIYADALLTVKQLAEVAILNPDAAPPFDVNDRFENPRDVLRILSGLVTTFFDFKHNEIVRIAHFSVQEYLVSDRVQIAQFFLGNELASHQAIARGSLHYIDYYAQNRVSDHFSDPSSNVDSDVDSDIDSGYVSQGLLHSSVNFWQDHARACEGTEFSITDLICECLNNEPWLKALNGLRSGVRGDNAPPLYWGSNSGLYSVVKKLMGSGVDVNTQGGYYGNALQAASVRGDIDIVRLLLEKGADIDAQGSYYGNALQTASVCRDIDIVRLLLEEGADINAQGGYYGNALQTASVRGDIDIVRLLLEKGADINAQGDDYGTALYAASIRGDVAVVQLLLEKGADVNARGGRYGNAFGAILEGVAKLEDVQRLMELLVEHGLEFDGDGDEEMSEAFRVKDYSLLQRLWHGW